MATVSDHAWDTAAIRRAIRLIGSHSPRIDDPQSTARALRLIWDIVQRRGAPTEIFQLPGTMPLVVIGHGPMLLITHLDDPHPLAQVEESGPPAIAGDTVTAPGVTRKSGVLAALGTVLGDDSIADMVTLVVEADRHDGSQSFAFWLDATERKFSHALCEVADLPIPAPAIFLASTGVATVQITVQEFSGAVERVFGGVQPDVGHALVTTLSALKSIEGEVLVPGFYDNVVTPDIDGLAAFQRVATSVGAWLNRGIPPSDGRLSSSHLTLGAFLAPSIVVRDLRQESTGPYLAKSASATVEARIMPGQDAAKIARSIAEFVYARIPDANVETLLLRPSARAPSLDTTTFEAIAPVFPVAAGNSPAGLLDSVGVPTIGFSTVWRNPSVIDEQISIASVAEQSSLIQALIRAIAGTRDGSETPR